MELKQLVESYRYYRKVSDYIGVCLYVKTTDEVRRLDKKNLLVFVRDRNVMEIRKMDYTENPIYQANRDIFVREASVADHITKVEKVDINYDSFRFNDIDRSRFVSDLSGRAGQRRSIIRRRNRQSMCQKNSTLLHPVPEDRRASECWGYKFVPSLH